MTSILDVADILLDGVDDAVAPMTVTEARAVLEGLIVSLQARVDALKVDADRASSVGVDESYAIEICVDCAVAAANGDFSGMGVERASVVSAALAACGGVVVVGDDAGFSWSSCDVCRSGLGGDRFAAVLLVVD